jgi:signal peptidase I
MKHKIDIKKNRGWIIVAAVIIIAIILRLCVFEFVNISGESMLPTLKDGQLIFIWKPFYTAVRGEIVVFNSPKKTEVVKRVIGLPGETIEIKEGVVYINGAKLDQKYQYPTRFSESMPATIIPADSIFLLGDNRDYSSDSRRFGAIRLNQIRGKMLFIVY